MSLRFFLDNSIPQAPGPGGKAREFEDAAPEALFLVEGDDLDWGEPTLTGW